MLKKIVSDKNRKVIAQQILTVLTRIPRSHLTGFYLLLKEFASVGTNADIRQQDIADEIRKIIEDAIGGSSGDVTEGTSIDADLRGLVNHRDWVGKQIRLMRQKIGINQAELAHRTGLTQSHVSRIESGGYVATFVTIQKIANALSVRPCDLDPSFPPDKI